MLGLALALAGVAGLYLFLGSFFIAMMQLLIYVGAICIAIVFAIMLSRPLHLEVPKRAVPKVAMGVAARGVFFVAVVSLVVRTKWLPSADAQLRTGRSGGRKIGHMLLTRYELVFEVISLVLLVAIIGAIVTAGIQPEDEFVNSLNTYLIIAAFLFSLGLLGVLQRRNLIGMLISVELMLNAANVNFMAFNRFLSPEPVVGQIIALFIMGLAAAEAAIGLEHHTGPVPYDAFDKYRTCSEAERIEWLWAHS